MINQAPETSAQDKRYALICAAQNNLKNLIIHLLEKYEQSLDFSNLLFLEDYLPNFDLQTKKVIFDKFKALHRDSTLTQTIYQNLTLQIAEEEEYFHFSVRT